MGKGSGKKSGYLLRSIGLHVASCPREAAAVTGSLLYSNTVSFIIPCFFGYGPVLQVPVKVLLSDLSVLIFSLTDGGL